jgi:hypothetical protein
MAICLRVEGPLRVRDALQFLASAVDDPKTVVREESRRTAARSHGGVTGLLSYVSDELQTLLSQAEHHPALRRVFVGVDVDASSEDEVGEDGVVRPDWEFFSWHDEEAAGYRCPWTINDFTLPPWVWEVLNEAA